jgi:hypothetical protein
MKKEPGIDLVKIYERDKIPEFENAHFKIEKFIKNVFYQMKVQELANKGLIRPAKKGKKQWELPQKFPGKPLSEYLKEIRE